MRTARLSLVQFEILAHLTMRGHAMTAQALKAELRKPFVSIETMNALRDYGYVCLTDQGWLATDAGRLRAHVV